jgi:PKD repeat protein
VIPYGFNSFDITADEGSLISFYRNGEILATATGTGMQQTIPLPSLPLNAHVSLTITKQNYYRYEADLPVEEILTANFTANNTHICPENYVNFTDMSVGDPLEWLWTFEGGDPATSTEQNPEGIMYAIPGDYDVTLEVTGAVSTNSYTIEDYIQVSENLVASIEISASAENICVGEEVSFTADAQNGGIIFEYQWKLNGVDVGTNTNTYVNDNLSDGDIVSCEFTSSVLCLVQNPVMSNEIEMSVNEIGPVAISIESNISEICEGSEVVFSAIPENGGDAPSYQWKLNGNNVGTNSSEYTTTELTSQDVVSCELISNSNCISGSNTVMSNDISINVLEMLPAGVSISASAGEICLGDEITFTATPQNEGSEPTYQWKVNGENAGENSHEFTINELSDDDVVSCEMTSSYDCAINNPAMSNLIIMMVTDYPVEMETPDGPIAVDLYESMNSSYTTGTDPNTLTYVWTVSPEEAYENLTPNENMLNIEWAEGFTGQASINVFGSNNCGDGPVSDNLEVSVANTFGIGENDLNVGVSIFPNPNNGTFTVKFSSEGNEVVKMQIRSILGEVAYSEEEISISGEFLKVIDLSSFAEGIYFLILENNDSVLTEKIVVHK